MFMGVGVAFAWGATGYTLGDGARMGPGYFPLALGVLLAFLGSIITFKALVVETADGDKIGKIALPPLGLIIGIYLLTFIASHAGEEFAFKPVLILATLLALLSYLAFIVLLKLQFPVWPAFLSA